MPLRVNDSRSDSGWGFVRGLDRPVTPKERVPPRGPDSAPQVFLSGRIHGPGRRPAGMAARGGPAPPKVVPCSRCRGSIRRAWPSRRTTPGQREPPRRNLRTAEPVISPTGLALASVRLALQRPRPDRTPTHRHRQHFRPHVLATPLVSAGPAGLANTEPTAGVSSPQPVPHPARPQPARAPSVSTRTTFATGAAAATHSGGGDRASGTQGQRRTPTPGAGHGRVPPGEGEGYASTGPVRTPRGPVQS